MTDEEFKGKVRKFFNKVLILLVLAVIGVLLYNSTLFTVAKEKDAITMCINTVNNCDYYIMLGKDVSN